MLSFFLQSMYVGKTMPFRNSEVGLEVKIFNVLKTHQREEKGSISKYGPVSVSGSQSQIHYTLDLGWVWNKLPNLLRSSDSPKTGLFSFLWQLNSAVGTRLLTVPKSGSVFTKNGSRLVE